MIEVWERRAARLLCATTAPGHVVSSKVIFVQDEVADMVAVVVFCYVCVCPVCTAASHCASHALSVWRSVVARYILVGASENEGNVFQSKKGMTVSSCLNERQVRWRNNCTNPIKYNSDVLSRFLLEYLLTLHRLVPLAFIGNVANILAFPYSICTRRKCLNRSNIQ